MVLVVNCGRYNDPMIWLSLNEELSNEGERKYQSETKGMEHILLSLLIPLSLSTHGAQIHLISINAGRS